MARLVQERVELTNPLKFEADFVIGEAWFSLMAKALKKNHNEVESGNQQEEGGRALDFG